MKAVFISDTHNFSPPLDFSIPEGDILIHSGDFSSRGNFPEVSKFLHWFCSYGEYKHRILVAGNHDLFCEDNRSLFLSMLPENIIYLEDSGVEVEGIKFWGSPVQPEFFNWAFNRTEGELARHWDRIPEDTDVLITHGPPWGILDYANRNNCGSTSLLHKVTNLNFKVHVFGHIHEGYGTLIKDGKTYINASICNKDYKPANKPIIMHIKGEK